MNDNSTQVVHTKYAKVFFSPPGRQKGQSNDCETSTTLCLRNISVIQAFAFVTVQLSVAYLLATLTATVILGTVTQIEATVCHPYDVAETYLNYLLVSFIDRLG